MTMQAADYVNISKKKYVLIDVEEGKQIITREPLKYKYDKHRTYKWRFRNNEIIDDEDD